jgi:transposase-like protein
MTRRIERDTIYRCRRSSAETIELCVRWYTTYRLSYRDLAAMMSEREVIVAHTTIMRWVLQYVPEYERRWARFAQPPGGSCRVDETAVAVRGGQFETEVLEYPWGGVAVFLDLDGNRLQVRHGR